jgi:amino acid adenylation domain-containing protein/thioester reductase-like protein
MFNCFLIGENHLMIQCTDILMENGFNILGIISDFLETEQYTIKKNIPFFKSLKEAENTIFLNNIDYFFSIVNKTILPQRIIEHIKKLTINYHDALLPRYAGVNATSWAILNNENEHGITWHTVNEIIDGGDILKQVVFPIEKDETAFSLNLKCHQYAINTFSELISELKNGTYVLNPQDLAKRTYNESQKKPPGNGWINWGDSGQIIERYFRASYLRSSTNHFSCLKFLLGEQCYVVSKLCLSAETSNARPGTIIEISNEEWKISTKNNVIIVGEINSIDGKQIALKTLEKHFKIRPGYSLRIPSFTELYSFQKMSYKLFSYENYWAEKLKNSTATIPFLDLVHVAQFWHSFKLLYSLDISEQYNQENFNLTFDVFWLTVWLIYLYRLGNSGIISIAISYPELRTMSNYLYPLINLSIPFDIQLTGEMDFKEAFDCVELAYSVVKTKKSCLRDISYRYSLKENNPGMMIVFFNENESINFDKLTNCHLLLAVNLSKKEISFYIQNFLEKNHFLMEFISGIKGHIQTLLKSIIAEKDCRIKSLLILTDKERITLIEKWNKTTTQFPVNKTVAEVFEHQVILTPTNIALKDNGVILTYQELNNLANKMARFLLRKGIKEREIIILYSFPNSKFIVSMLALLKIGGTYIPIDPQVSTYNIEIILNDSKASGLLISKECQTEFLTNSKLSNQVPIFYIENCLNLSLDENQNNLEQQFSSNHVAHVLYTSGTTGKPKGVLIPHYAINRLVRNTNYIKINSEDTFALASSVSFDASTFEIMGALLNGACLVCISRSLLLNPSRFGQFIEKEAITVLWLTSELFNQYASLNPAMFKNLNYLLVGGDTLNPEKIKLILDCAAGSPKYLLNGYGPTENTTFTTTFYISKKSTKRARIPIGEPISNTTVYVLDKMLNPVPIGVAGNLYTGGKGLAYGYLNNPELTKIKFIPNPFSNELNDKLYNTGDIVRWLPNGNLDYLGRREDQQVKIRGLRVELEAVKGQILHFSSVSQCFVTVISDKQRGKLLVAYIVPIKGKKVLVSNLKKFLSKFLPDFMIPNHFILLDKLPLTSNGKVNAKALPSLLPIQVSKKKSRGFKNNLRESLLKIWAKMFSIEEIGIHDNFFSLGGTSLLMTRLLMALENNFGFQLSLPAFFQEPTINGLIKLMSSQQQTKFSDIVLKTILQDTTFAQNNYTSIFPKSHCNHKEEGIFLTGATGFLGAHLLHDLVKMTKQTIYCLVREKNFQFLDRLVNTIASKYHLDIPKDRVILIQGDLALPYLGMAKEDFFDLAKKIAIVYHNAAHVHHIYNYTQVREANVLGTLETIKLASVNHAPLHYVSTLSAVLNFVDDKGMIKENLIQNVDKLIIQDGYSQTKLVSEHLLSQAANYGLPVHIYRPGWILGQEKTGIIAADNNHLLLLIKGCIQMGIAPNWDVKLNIVPVDFVSKFIISVSCMKDDPSKVFNLGNDQYVNWIDLIEVLSHYFPMRIISESNWRAALHTLDEQNAIFELLPIYLNSSKEWVVNLGKICHIDHHNTSFATKKLGLDYPCIDRDLISRYIHYLIQIGFFKKTLIKEGVV